MSDEYLAAFSRSALARLFDNRKDVDQECGYKTYYDTTDFLSFFKTDGVAHRVVSVIPNEVWSQHPRITTGEAEESEFDRAVLELDAKFNIFSVMHRADVLSGIGQYGTILLGLADGKDLDQPVDQNKTQELTFLRVFDELSCRVMEYDTDQKSARFGQPKFYLMQSVPALPPQNGQPEPQPVTNLKVHHSRIVHLADNRMCSEVLGLPRMQPVIHRLVDLRKLLGGSAEMFWRGAFPGYSFEVDPTLTDTDLDDPEVQKKMKAQFEAFSSSLQRYMAVAGVSTKSLAPQVASPKEHVDVQLMCISICLEVPFRVFVGSEEGKLASGQDKGAWNQRLAGKQKKYTTPHVIRPLIDAFVAYGILPDPGKYDAIWPDLDSPTEAGRAEISQKVTDCLAKYVAGNVEAIIPLEQFLIYVMEFPAAVAKKMIEDAQEQVRLTEPTGGTGTTVPQDGQPVQTSGMLKGANPELARTA